MIQLFLLLLILDLIKFLQLVNFTAGNDMPLLFLVLSLSLLQLGKCRVCVASRHRVCSQLNHCFIKQAAKVAIRLCFKHVAYLSWAYKKVHHRTAQRRVMGSWKSTVQS